MASELCQHSSPPVQSIFARLLCLGIFLLLLAAGQGCVNNSSERSFERGLEASRGPDHDLAIADYNEAIRLDPKNAAAYNNRGFAYGQKGDYDKALADFSEAIRLKPDYAVAY